jgi:hypothetical protein
VRGRSAGRNVARYDLEWKPRVTCLDALLVRQF